MHLLAVPAAASGTATRIALDRLARFLLTDSPDNELHRVPLTPLGRAASQAATRRLAVSENASSNTASVAIVILVIVAMAFAYFIFIRTNNNDAHLEIEIKDGGDIGALAPDGAEPFALDHRALLAVASGSSLP
jgi:hypothetical protein